jgi:hypothetical protein
MGIGIRPARHGTTYVQKPGLVEVTTKKQQYDLKKVKKLMSPIFSVLFFFLWALLASLFHACLMMFKV